MRGVFLGYVLIAAVANFALADYIPGYVWNRQSSWYDGNGDGSTNGNPNVDSMGNPTWEYVALNGGGLGSSNPWYADTTPSVLGTYDTSGGYGWVGGNAYCFQDTLINQWGEAGTPGVIWLNPTDESITVSLNGLVQFSWDNGLSASSDYAIAAENLQTHTAAPLFSTTVSSSGNNSVPINIDDLSLAPDEGLLFTFKGDTTTYLDYYESDSINITLDSVPLPSAVAGGFVLIGGIAIGKIAHRSRRKSSRQKSLHPCSLGLH